eukprot:symbB.v1.2.033100.t1/scaffold3920.1/size48317/4
MRRNFTQPDIASYSVLLMECQQRELPNEMELLLSLPALEEGKEAELARERDTCQRAKKKVRQLLAKLSERDGKIMELTLKLEAKTSKSGKEPGRVAKQRAQIVAQLEELLVQMRQDLQLTI